MFRILDFFFAFAMHSQESERNTSYNITFNSIFLKLCRCFAYGREMCMWFGHYHQILFNLFFKHINLVNFAISDAMSGYFVSASLPTILFRSF